MLNSIEVDPKRPSDVARMRQVAGAETAIPHGGGGLMPQKSSVILGTQATILIEHGYRLERRHLRAGQGSRSAARRRGGRL